MACNGRTTGTHVCEWYEGLCPPAMNRFLRDLDGVSKPLLSLFVLFRLSILPNRLDNDFEIETGFRGGCTLSLCFVFV
jgi:hypothetical protein